MCGRCEKSWWDAGPEEDPPGSVVTSFATAGAGGRGRIHVSKLGGGFVLRAEDVPAEFTDGVEDEFAEVEVFLSAKAAQALVSWIERNA
jgi:hypothetical protein